eukprot:g36855.t1
MHAPRIYFITGTCPLRVARGWPDGSERWLRGFHLLAAAGSAFRACRGGRDHLIAAAAQDHSAFTSTF